MKATDARELPATRRDWQDNTNSPPNVVWLVSDHQAHANHPALESPGANLPLRQYMARNGVQFDRAYTVLPVCTPARTSMLTGFYPHRHGITENEGRFGGREGLREQDRLLSHDLADIGYRCAYFGKWHLSDQWSAQEFGFEGFSLPGYGYPYGTEEYRAYLERYDLPEPVVFIEQAGESGQRQGQRPSLMDEHDWFDYEAGSAILETPAATHEAYFVSRLACEWLESHRDGGMPFFLRVDPWGPHPPYIVAPPFLGIFDHTSPVPTPSFSSDLSHRPQHHRDYREYWHEVLGLDLEHWQRQIARCCEHVALVDSALHEVLLTLERLGLLENTVVFFTSDHGDAIGSNGGISNKGGLMVEETLRVPLLACGPPPIACGQTCGSLVTNMDITSTIADLCGLDIEERLDGKSLMPLMKQPSAADWRDTLMVEHYGLHVPLFQRALLTEQHKLVVQQDGFEELYDLHNDPAELVNLAGREAHRETLVAMRVALASAMRQFDDSCDEALEVLTFLEGLPGQGCEPVVEKEQRHCNQERKT
jgi:arylsulfatase A-like enzyme